MVTRIVLAGFMLVAAVGCGKDEKHACDRLNDWLKKCAGESLTTEELGDCKTGYASAPAACKAATDPFFDCVEANSCEAQEDKCAAQTEKFFTACGLD